MKKQWKGFVGGFLSAVLVLGLCIPVLASTVKQLNASYNNIKITLDGKALIPRDPNGAVVEPFIVDGTTYLPLRAVAQALGLGVGWDQNTSTVMLTSDGSTPNTPSVNTPGNKGESYKVTYQNCRIYDSSFGGSTYYAIVEIENDGTENLYLKDATFDFEDRGGHLLETKSFISSDPEIIAPGEKGYFFASGSLEKVTAGTDYVFNPSVKVEKAKNSIIRYAILDTSKENASYGRLNITGRVQNNTDKDDSMIWVAIILYRADGTPIVAGGTNVMDVKSGETASFSRNFTANELGVDPSEVSSFKVYAGKMQIQF